MESPLLRLLISYRSVNKHGRHRQFLFMMDHLAKRFQRRLIEINQSENKNCLWRPIFASQGLRFGSPFSPPLADLEYILNIKIRPLVTEYALMIKLMDAHSFNPYVYFGHSWSYFDI
jgi:hypothetical protein